MKRIIVFAICLVTALSCAQNAEPEAVSFIVMGDIHYCEDRFYDLDAMLAEKPDDWRQITKTYAPVTAANWKDQMAVIKEQVRASQGGIKCIVQLGDVSEGLANVDGNAEQMALNMTRVLEECNMGVPWIITKGNHDITGVGEENKVQAKEAFGKCYTPFIKAQTGKEDVQEGNYTWQTGDVLFVVLDAYNRQLDQTEFARKALESSDAKYKFVCMHEPAIPATERCWHFLKSATEEKRAEFLKVIASNKAFFLCAHLHRYSVLRRNTEWGPIVQVMAASVTDLKRRSEPSYELTTSDYGEGLVDFRAEFNPATADQRRATLRAEAPYVDYYKIAALPGYGVISIEPSSGDVILKYYPAFEKDIPYDTVNLSELYRTGKTSR